MHTNRLAALASTAVIAVVGAYLFLALTIYSNGRSDCHRSQAIVGGIYKLLDRSTMNATTQLAEHKITKTTFNNTLKVNNYIKATITYPSC